MSIKRHEIPYEKIFDLTVLPEHDLELIREARNACQMSYAPYSGFYVGAAARMEDGKILRASNQESEVFPSGMCAERILLYRIQAECPDHKIISVAVAAVQNDKPVENEVNPCGACAQVFLDTEKRQDSPIRILMCGAHTCSIIDSSSRLLPFSFEFKHLKE